MCAVLKKQVGRFPAKVLGNVGDNHKAEGCTFFTRTPWRIFCPHMIEKGKQKHRFFLVGTYMSRMNFLKIFC